MRIIVGITGASGVQLGVRLVECLKGRDTIVIVSDAAWKLMRIERGCESFIRLASRDTAQLGKKPRFEGMKLLGEKDFDAPVASGSFRFDGMAVMPCSMKTLSAIATGYADSLIVRAAENALRLNRRLVLVPRETPLSLSALENMVRLRTAGAVILPPVLAFYHRPAKVEDLVDYVVGKVLDALGIEHNLYRRWGE